MRIFLIAIICLLCSASAGLTQTTYTTKKGFFCDSLSNFDKLVNYKIADDAEGAESLFKNGSCLYLDGVVRVNIVDKNKTGRVVKIKVIGTDLTVWTLKASLTP